ncbi:pyridoxine 5'-phosphate synthase [Rhodoplanes roseus]|uniref:Pyridoxine 5'-phosphate synthase n=1 Tax=Rhodoplanes roseus TaxID=29409 RepID=A0A327KGG3_9BRAD|nr:pyridoxine 5'-phosphate synthase [Rhodoplanes roseus]RAI37850.1 pyridoxine 5'-phosphate synthase [Rhodoplanes roseus]
MTASPLRLGVNVDHVATLRNARGGRHPDPLRAAEIAVAAGANGITAHLREDRRHIRDDDMERLKRHLTVPLNMEMAATSEMVEIALRLKPHATCLVPERREERTTEGGLDAAGQRAELEPRVKALCAAGIRVSLFVAPDPVQLDAAVAVGAPVVELHTGAWCEAIAAGEAAAARAELDRIVQAARGARARGLEVHAGHGLDPLTAETIAALPEVVELNIGHWLVAESVFDGLEGAIRRMLAAMKRGRGGAPARN